MLEEIIREAAEELRAREKARDEAYGRARRARMLSKQAILLLHNGNQEKAIAKLDEAGSLLKEISVYTEEFTEIRSYENTGKGYPSPGSLGLGPKNYILGLADVPGELRRQTLDLLRDGDLEAAQANLATMEQIYLNLTGMEEASLLLKGLRRKLDVVRMVNERTRAEITTEVSRERLRRQLGELGDRLGG